MRGHEALAPASEWGRGRRLPVQQVAQVFAEVEDASLAEQGGGTNRARCVPRQKDRPATVECPRQATPQVGCPKGLHGIVQAIGDLSLVRNGEQVEVSFQAGHRLRVDAVAPQCAGQRHRLARRAAM